MRLVEDDEQDAVGIGSTWVRRYILSSSYG